MAGERSELFRPSDRDRVKRHLPRASIVRLRRGWGGTTCTIEGRPAFTEAVRRFLS